MIQFAPNRQHVRRKRTAGTQLLMYILDYRKVGARTIVSKDIVDGDKVGIQGTPTIFINGKCYNGSFEMVLLKPVLDAELKGKK
jgi:hypothetical protein